MPTVSSPRPCAALVFAALVATVAWAAGPALALPDEPIRIDTGPQFVHDDYLVDNYWVPGHSRAIVERHFHPPVHAETNPVLVGERFSYFSVHRGDDGKFRLWYQLFNPRTIEPDAPKDLPRYGIGYAESDDGVNWRVPQVGQHEWRGSTDNNVVWMGVDDRGAAGGFVIELPERHSRGYTYAMLYQTHSGMHLVGSRDGVTWDKASDVRLKHLHSDTFNAITYDPQADRWFIYCRPRNIYRNWEDDKDQGAVRRVAVMSSKDLWSEWTDEPSTTLVPDAIDAERGFTFFYGMPVRHYGGVFWGFLWPFQMNTVILNELAFSRNGADWQRLPKRPRLLEPGPEGAWDDGQVITTPHWIEVGDEWWIYYTGQDGPHNRPKTNTSSLGLLKLRKEGFISRYGPPLGGRLCTRPIVWPGGDLLVNAAAAGNLRVRAVDPMRNPIEGFTYDDCDVMAGDSVAHPIRWGGRSLHELAGKAVRLEFELRDAHLYTFRATGERLNDTRLAALAAKLAQAEASTAPSVPTEPAPAMEAAERPDDTVASPQSPAVDAGELPQPTGQPLIHFTFDNDAPLRGEGTLGLTLSLGEKSKEEATSPRVVPAHGHGQALSFTGEADVAYTQVRDALPDAGVLQLRFRADRDLDRSLDIHKYLFHLYGDSKNRDLLRIDRDRGQVVFESLRKGKSTITLRSKAGFTAGTWHEVTVAFGPDSTRLFIDGELHDQWGDGNGWSSLASPVVYVGSVPPPFGAGYAFPGLIDDVRVHGPAQDTTAADNFEAMPAEQDDASADAARRALAMQGPGVAPQGDDAEPTAAFQDGQLTSLRLGGRDLLTQPHGHPLWMIEFAEPGAQEAVTIAADGSGASGFRVSAKNGGDHEDAVTSRRWTITDPDGRRVATVEAWATRTGDGALDFHLALDQLDGRYIIRKAWYPQLPLARLGEQPQDDYLLVPSMHGQVYRDVHARPLGPWGRGTTDILQAIHRTRYPSKFGNLQMQFYGDDETAGGLLMMTPDPARRIKDLIVDRADASSPLRARFGHHLTAEAPVTGRVELAYPVRLRWVDGDWYDAGRAYRAWAIEQAWARPELALGRRDDLPDWFAGLPSWVRIPADPSVPFEEKTSWPLQWVEAVGGPMGVHWYGWGKDGGPWNFGFPRDTEPHPQFASLLEQYRAAGLKVMPYTNARVVDMDEPGVWSQYKDAVVRTRQGDVAAKETWPYYATREQAEAARAAGKQVKTWGDGDGPWFHVMHDFAVGWMGAEAWRESVRRRTTRLFLEHNVDAVYHDQLGVYPMFQHHPPTGEAPADPLAWQTHEQSLYTGLRDGLRGEGVQPVLISEYLSEALMPNIVGGLTVFGIGHTVREPVPLWSTVYHTHFAPIGWQDDPSQLADPQVYLHARMVPLAWGAQLGWITYTMERLIEKHQPIVDAYRAAVTLRRENPTTLGWGEMLRPPVLEGVAVRDVPLPGEDEAHQQWPAILAGYFRDAQDPSRALAVFANWTDEPQTATALLDTSAFTGRVTAERQDGTTLEAGAGEPLRVPLNLPPMSIESLPIREVQP